MHQTLKVKEERREPELEIEPDLELVHLQHEPHQQQQRDKQQSVELKMSAESKEISSVKQEAAAEVAEEAVGEAGEAGATVATVVMEGATNNRCAGCREPIRDKFIFSVIDLNWHQDCVQCADCLLKLNERCHTYDGKLYCRQDYWRRFGPKCFACKESIERNELVQIIKGNRIYHLKCFTCSECNKQLKAGEQLHLLEGKRLLCKQDYHHHHHHHNQQLTHQVCKSPPPSYRLSSSSSPQPPNNNKSFIQSSATSSPTQQHTISATYYTLMSSQKQQEQTQKQQQTILNRRPNKIESIRPSLSADEAGDCGGGGGGGDDDDMEAFETDEQEAGGCDDELELDDESFEMRSLLGFDSAAAAAPDNNLENEENRSVLRFGQAATDDAVNNQTTAGLSGVGQLSSGNRLRKGAPTSRAESVEGGEVKRRRRRRKKLQTAGGGGGSGGNSSGSTKRLTNRNGESILNGMPPASSILAMHGSSLAAIGQSATSLQQQQQQQLQAASIHQTKSVPSSAASTASNSSTSSSMSLTQGSNHGSSQHHPHHNSHHHHHQHQQHQHQHQHQQQQQQQQHHHHQRHHHQQNQQRSGSTGQTGSGAGHKPTRVRTVLNEKQLQTLRDCYGHNPRPDALMKEQLVEMTGLSSRVIRVWFQNKRCKDKKKSIQHKQMLQYEKDGRHLAGLTLMRGVPLVASSPIQYDDHSTVSSTPGLTQQQPQQQQQSQPQSGTTMLELQSSGSIMQQQQPSGCDPDSSPLMVDPQQQQSNRAGGHFAPAPSVHSPANPQQPQPVDIHAYQPPWKNLIEYANHGATPPDRLNTASPRYQQLIGQVHGYSSARTDQGEQPPTEHRHSIGGQFQQIGMSSFANAQPTATTTATTISPLMEQQQQQAPMGHLHQFQH